MQESRQREKHGAAQQETNGRAGEDDSELAQAIREVRELIEAARQLALLRLLRLRARLRKGAFVAVFALWAALVGLVVTIAAALALVRGVAAGLTAATGGTPWLGELLTGALVLGAIAAGLWLVYRSRVRRAAERLRARWLAPTGQAKAVREENASR